MSAEAFMQSGQGFNSFVQGLQGIFGTKNSSSTTQDSRSLQNVLQDIASSGSSSGVNIQDLLEEMVRSSSETQTGTTAEQSIQDILSAITGTTSDVQSARSGTEASRAALDALTAQLVGNVQNFQGVDYSNLADQNMEAAILNVMRQGIGNVLNTDVNSGAYNSTAQQLMANNLRANAAAQGAEARSATILQGAAQNEQIRNNMVNSLGAILDISGRQTQDIVRDIAEQQRQTQQQSTDTTSQQELARQQEEAARNTQSGEQSYTQEQQEQQASETDQSTESHVESKTKGKSGGLL